MPATESLGVIEIRALATDVVVLSVVAPGVMPVNVTGRSLGDALSELAVLVSALEVARVARGDA